MHFSEALLSFPCLSLCLQRMLFCRGCFSAVVWTSQSNFAPSSSNSCPGWCNWENLLFCFVFISHLLLAGQNQLVVLWLLLFFIQLLFFLSFCAEEPGQLRRSKHAIHSETAWCPSERHWGELCSQAGNECSGVFPACNSTKSLQRPLSSLSGAVLRVVWADREAFYLVLCRNAVCCMWCFYSAYKRVWNLLPVSENWFKQF